MNRKGFTLIELLIVVVIIGILAAIAIPKSGSTKQRAIMAGMKTDLRNLVTAQEGFYFDNENYASGYTSGAQVNQTSGAGGMVSIRPTTGNVLAITYVGNTGYSATITNPLVNSTPSTCGVYIGPGNSPNPA
ncbi:MAG: type II secretion system protein, partial [Gemmatimonadales bacterium]